MKKSVLDLAGPTRTGVWCILYDGQLAGSYVVAYPADGASLLRALFRCWSGPIRGTIEGSAAGYGYCKASGAFQSAVSGLDLSPAIRATLEARDLHGAGMSTCEAWMAQHGYSMRQVL